MSAACAKTLAFTGARVDPMAKQKRKLTAAQKAEKRRRQREFMTIFVNGKQKRVKREPTIDGLPVDEFIRRNADPVWLMQHGMYEELHEYEQAQKSDTVAHGQPEKDVAQANDDSDDDLPF